MLAQGAPSGDIDRRPKDNVVDFYQAIRDGHCSPPVRSPPTEPCTVIILPVMRLQPPRDVR